MEYESSTSSVPSEYSSSSSSSSYESSLSDDSLPPTINYADIPWPRNDSINRDERIRDFATAVNYGPKRMNEITQHMQNSGKFHYFYSADCNDTEKLKTWLAYGQDVWQLLLTSFFGILSEKYSLEIRKKRLTIGSKVDKADLAIVKKMLRAFIPYDLLKLTDVMPPDTQANWPDYWAKDFLVQFSSIPPAWIRKVRGVSDGLLGPASTVKNPNNNLTFAMKFIYRKLTALIPPNAWHKGITYEQLNDIDEAREGLENQMRQELAEHADTTQPEVEETSQEPRNRKRRTDEGSNSSKRSKSPGPGIPDFETTPQELAAIERDNEYRKQQKAYTASLRDLRTLRNYSDRTPLTMEEKVQEMLPFPLVVERQLAMLGPNSEFGRELKRQKDALAARSLPTAPRTTFTGVLQENANNPHLPAVESEDIQFGEHPAPPPPALPERVEMHPVTLSSGSNDRPSGPTTFTGVLENNNSIPKEDTQPTAYTAKQIREALDARIAQEEARNQPLPLSQTTQIDTLPEAIAWYQSDSNQISKVMRGEIFGSEKDRKAIAILEEAMKTLPTITKNTTLYRGGGGDYVKSLRKGNVFTRWSRMFISTSTSESEAAAFARNTSNKVLYRIHVGKGDRGIFIQTGHHLDKEQEVLLPPTTFVIQDISFGQDVFKNPLTIVDLVPAPQTVEDMITNLERNAPPVPESIQRRFNEENSIPDESTQPSTLTAKQIKEAIAARMAQEEARNQPLPRSPEVITLEDTQHYPEPEILNQEETQHFEPIDIDQTGGPTENIPSIADEIEQVASKESGHVPLQQQIVQDVAQTVAPPTSNVINDESSLGSQNLARLTRLNTPNLIPIKKRPKRKGKELKVYDPVDVPFDILEAWDVALNADHTAPLDESAFENINLSTARLVKCDRNIYGHRYFGRRVILSKTGYQHLDKLWNPTWETKGSLADGQWLKQLMPVKFGLVGIHVVTSTFPTIDRYRTQRATKANPKPPMIERKLIFKDNIKFWNLSPYLAKAADSNRKRAYLTAPPGEGYIHPRLSQTGYLAVDPVGRPIDKTGHLILVREITPSHQDMLFHGGLALYVTGENGQPQVAARTDDKGWLRVLLPDSGAEVSEITSDVAKMLGLYGPNKKYSLPGAKIVTTTGFYNTRKIRLTLGLKAEDVKNATTRFSEYPYPPLIYHNIEFYYPETEAYLSKSSLVKNYAENQAILAKQNSWDILIGVSTAVQMHMILEFTS